jgi:protoporphyrinogen/coproporphyrinogen III oxidase
VSAPQVLIVGGGLAGASAAVTLRGAGCAVKLLEREARAGGRAAGTVRNGFRLDAAPFLVGAGERRLLDLVAAAGLAERLLPLRPLELCQPRSGGLDLAPPAGRPLEVARIGGVRLWEALRLSRLSRLERRFADLLDPEAPELAVRLDDRSVADFLRVYFGPSLLERWAEPVLGSDFLADAGEVSRVAFLLARRARGAAPLGTLRGSPAELVEALLQPEADECGVEARALTRDGDGFSVESSAGPRRADAVVLALPAPETLRLAGPLLAAAEREGLAGLRSVPAIVMHVAVARAPARKATRVRAPRVEGGPLATLAVEPGGPGSPAPADAALISLVARAGWSRAQLEADDEVIAKELIAALDRRLPRASATHRFHEIRRYPAALPHFEVGSYRRLARLRRLGAEARAQGRRLYLAGDGWLAPTLEGAAASGRRAALELCADFGLAAAAPTQAR